jgi:nicotinamidase-related amidase
VDGRLGRREGEQVITKQAASAFHGTGMAALLAASGIDCIVLTGATTSGCVRATAIDACSLGYRTVVPAPCVGDRHPAAHAANLFDIDAKYADVIGLDDALTLVSRVPSAGAVS